MRGAAGPITEADLHSFVDGQLPPDRRRQLAAYLQANPLQAARLQDWQLQNRSLVHAFRHILDEPLPVSLSLNISAAARYVAQPAQVGHFRKAEEPARTLSDQFVPVKSSPASGFIGFMLGLSLAFALAGIALFGLQSWPYGRQAAPANDPKSRMTQYALEAHRTFADDKTHAWEMSATKPADLLQWLSQRAGTPITAPDLSGEGLKLAGGRILPGDYAPLAMLIYENANGERVSLLAGRQLRGANQPLLALESGLLSVATGNKGSTAIALVAATSANHVDHIARMIESQVEPGQ